MYFISPMKLFFKILFKGLYHFTINPQKRTFLWLVLRYGDRKRYKPTKLKFLNYEIQAADCLSFIWQFEEIFVENSYEFKADTETPLIIDCGSNIGVTVIYFKRIYPESKILAFEADPKIAEILVENIKANKINNVEVFNKAVWKNDGTLEIVPEGADAASIYGKGKKIQVESLRLKNILKANKEIDFLKVDIEGAETEVIKDCNEELQKVKNIFIEYHSYFEFNQGLDEILSILTNNGFRYFIKPIADRSKPFIQKMNKNNPQIDLQLNIFAYKLV